MHKRADTIGCVWLAYRINSIFFRFSHREERSQPHSALLVYSEPSKIQRRQKHSSFSRLAGTEGVEPSRCRSQSPVPYLLAISLCHPTALQAATVAQRRTKSIVMLGYIERSSPCILYHKSRHLSRLMRSFPNHQPIYRGIRAS